VPAVALAAIALLASLLPAGAMAEDICGVIWSGNHPVSGAQVLASAEGVLTTSNSDGRFCLSGLTGKLQKVQILALGFHAVETWAHVDAEGEELRIELVPLRTLQFGQLGGAVATGSGDGDSFPPGPELQQKTADAVALGLTPDPAFLVLPSDSLPLNSSPADPASKSLVLLNDALMAGAPVQDSSATARYWIEVSQWAGELEQRCCSLTSDGKESGCGLTGEACSYLDRAVVTALARAHLWGETSEADELSRRLRELEENGESELQEWARMIARRLHLPLQERR
jgi:hypothetical protein